MPEKIFDPTIHQDLAHLEGYKFRNSVLVETINQFRRGSPKYKDASCAEMAQYIGLGESTLKKLKTGQNSDPRSSTLWLIWKAFGVEPCELLGIPGSTKCRPDQCNNTSRALLDEKDKRIAELESGNLKREYMITRRNKLIAMLILFLIGLLIADILMPAHGWLRLGSH